MHTVEHVLLIASVLLLVAVLATRASRRTGVPSLLLFLFIGMLAGSDGFGGIWFDNAALGQAVGTVALAVILFAGGLGTHWGDARSILGRALSLGTLGVVVTAVATGLFSAWLLDLSLAEGLLLGAIVSSTDAAAVFSILRSQGLRLRGALQPLLELESGGNDPMAVFLTIAFTRVVSDPGVSGLDLVPVFFLQMTIGAAVGFVCGRAGLWLLNHIELEVEGLYPVMMVSIVLLTFAATASAGGSGFLAVYVAGVLMGNAGFIHKRSLTQFMDALSWLMQIAMFLLLGLLVFPSHLPQVAGPAALIAIFLIIVARPASVFLALAFSRFNFREKVFVSWVGLRGAVPIVLATFPLLAGVPRAELCFDLVFFVVLTSLLIQGTTVGRVARVLGLNDSGDVPHGPALEFVRGSQGKSELTQFLISAESPVKDKRLIDIAFPPSSLVVLITRDDRSIVPRGNTVLNQGDTILVLSDRQQIPQLSRLLEGGLVPN